MFHDIFKCYIDCFLSHFEGKDMMAYFVLTGLVLFIVISAIVNTFLFYKEGREEVWTRILNSSIIITLAWLFWGNQGRYISMDLLFQGTSEITADLSRHWLFYLGILIFSLAASYRTKAMNFMNIFYVLVFYYILEEAYKNNPENLYNENVTMFFIWALPFYLYFSVGALVGKKMQE